MNIYISKNGQQLGPYSAEQVQQSIDSGQLSPSDLACGEGGAQWVPVASLLGPPVKSSGGGSKTVWVILAVCFGLLVLMVGGGLGVYFYIDGKKQKAAEVEVEREVLAARAAQEEWLKNAAKANEEAAISNAKEFVGQRNRWIDITKAIQDVFEEVTPEVYILSTPNEMHLATTTIKEVNDKFTPEGLTNATTAIWIESLATTAPTTLGGGAGGMGGGAGGMSAVPSGTGSATAAELPDVDTIYLKLKAKNIMPRQRETLNREFAQMIAARFRASELFVVSEEETMVIGNIPANNPKDRWFEFTLQLKLKHPIKMQDMEETEFGELGPHLRQLIPRDTIASMNSGEFIVYMISVIEELNQNAREARVGVPSESTNRTAKVQYNFTFKQLRSTPDIAKDKLPELQTQLNDIRTISDILYRSEVQSIVALKRTRVTREDLLAGKSNDYLDARQTFSDKISVVRPYQVRFRCLSGGIAKVLNGFAAEKYYFVVRKMEVTQLGAKRGGAGGGMGDRPTKVISLAQLQVLIKAGLATPKVRNVIGESILEVELDVDVIRRTSQSPDPLDALEEPLASEWNRLRAIASATKPPALGLDGTNHMVFNPRKWKEIVVNTGEDPIMVPDSIEEPLGVSALQVTKIDPVRLIVTPIARLALGGAKVQYKFEQMDYYPMLFRQLPPAYGPISTFLPHLPQAQKTDRRLTREVKRGPVELHWWYNQSQAIQNNVRLYHPDWIVKIDFKNATLEPSEKVDEVRFDLDIIYQTPGGQVITQPYKNVQSKSPIAIIRAYQADFLFRTKYHAAKNFNAYREGRHIMMDGEALLIYKITPNEVHLVSDLAFGGNGKLYIKKLKQVGERE